jgi:hypothetical protein
LNPKRIHVVFSKHIETLEHLLNQYGAVTGWTSSMEDACLWARDGGRPDPDIILINGVDFYREFKPKKGADPDVVFLDLIRQIQSYRSESRIILLLPESKDHKSRLIYDLVCEGIYDYWFLDTLDQQTLELMINEPRDAETLDRYLEQLGFVNESPAPAAEAAPLLEASAWDDPVFHKENVIEYPKPAKPTAAFQDKIRPEIKSAVVAFWSEDDCLLSYGSGILLAFYLAEKGFKVALLEGISKSPRLASALGIRHPFFNTGHALSLFARGQDKPFQSCLFNTEIYKKDPNAFDNHAFLQKYPAPLYFLPDERRRDNVDMEVMRLQWDRFLMEMTKWCLFDQEFHFLIYVCHGQSLFNKILLEMAHVKMIGIQPWPSSVASGMEIQRQWPGQCVILWGDSSGAFQKEAKVFPRESLMVKPDSFERDAMSLFYFKKTLGFFDAETKNYLDQLSGRLTTHRLTFKDESARNLIQKLKESFAK